MNVQYTGNVLNVMKPVHISHLSIASWNVQGLLNKEGIKTEDPFFVNEIKKHHIVALQETHSVSYMSIIVPGYYSYQVSRPKSGNKAHGGIAILVRDDLRAGVKFYPAEISDILWVCLKKGFFNTNNDVYIGAKNGDVVKSRSVVSIVPGGRWSKEAIMNVRGTPHCRSL